MAGFGATSPRLRDGRRATMGSFGSLLPRPSNSASSPRLSARTTRQSAPPSGSTTSPSGVSLTRSVSAADWQGVIGMLTGGCGPSSGQAKPHKKSSEAHSTGAKERDGYEVFFGVTEGEFQSKIPDRDGFDIFYGIKNDERAGSAPGTDAKGADAKGTDAKGTDAKGDASCAKDHDAQLRSRISQVAHPRRERRLTAPPQVGTSGPKHSVALRSPRSTATAVEAKPKPSAVKSKRASKPEVPESVPTFSLATPAPSFAPELSASHHNENPSGVPLYSMATPASSFAPPAQ